MNSLVQWLNSTFSSFDYTILLCLHRLAEITNGGITVFFKFLSLVSEKGAIFIVLSLAMIFIKKTRERGICLFGALGCSSVVTLLLKDYITRLRPFESGLIYMQWWEFISSPADSGFSFPSGHTTVIMAAATALFLTSSSKHKWLHFIYVGFVAVSRCYLMVHYPSDILGGLFVGAIGAFIAFYVTKMIYKFSNKSNIGLLKRLLV